MGAECVVFEIVKPETACVYLDIRTLQYRARKVCSMGPNVGAARPCNKSRSRCRNGLGLGELFENLARASLDAVQLHNIVAARGVNQSRKWVLCWFNPNSQIPSIVVVEVLN